MANITIEKIEPVATDVRKLTLFFDDAGQVLCAHVTGERRNTSDSTTEVIDARVDRDDLSAGEVSEFEALTTSSASLLGANNGH